MLGLEFRRLGCKDEHVGKGLESPALKSVTRPMINEIPVVQVRKC